MGDIIPPPIYPSSSELNYLMDARSPHHADVIVGIEVDNLALEQLLMLRLKFDVVCWFDILPVLELSRYRPDLLVEGGLVKGW